MVSVAFCDGHRSISAGNAETDDSPARVCSAYLIKQRWVPAGSPTLPSNHHEGVAHWVTSGGGHRNSEKIAAAVTSLLPQIAESIYFDSPPSTASPTTSLPSSPPSADEGHRKLEGERIAAAAAISALPRAAPHHPPAPGQAVAAARAAAAASVSRASSRLPVAGPEPHRRPAAALFRASDRIRDDAFGPSDASVSDAALTTDIRCSHQPHGGQQRKAGVRIAFAVSGGIHSMEFISHLRNDGG